MKRLPVYFWVLLALLPALLLRDFTPNHELRYLSIADEALRNGTFFTFSHQGVPYADKPPLYFWLVMLCKVLFGEYRMWFLGLCSLLPAFVVVRTMDRWVRPEADGEQRLTGRWMMLTCGLFLGMAVYLRMDMLMCMFIVLSLRVFHRMYRGEGRPRRDVWLFAFYVFMALFSKGPVGILVPLLGTLAFLLLEGRIRTVGRYWGWPTWTVLLGGCLLWFGAVWWEGGTAYLDNLLFHQTVDRAVNSFHHQRPFYYYLVSVWYSLAPWSLLVVGLLVTALLRRRVSTELERLFFTVTGVTFVMLSCISSKVEVYLLPAFPFMVYGALLCLPRFARSAWTRAAVALPAVVFACVLPSGVVLAQVRPRLIPDSVWIWAAAVALTVGGVASLAGLLRRRDVHGGIRSLAVGLMAALFLGGWSLPRLNENLGYGALCHKGMELAREHGVDDFYTWRLSRSVGMDAYLHRPVREVPPEEASSMQGFVYMLPAKRLGDLPASLRDLPVHRVGKYAIVVVR